MLPPRIVRRLVFAPLVILISVAAIVLSPVLLLLAMVTAPTRVRRRRTLRLVRFGLAWLAMESAALVACLALWIASGFGGRLRTETSLERHYALVRWFLATLFRLALRIFHLRVEIEEPPATDEEMAARLTRPVIVLSRHAGPGDSFLLVHHLLSLYRRRPRIVMKAALQFDPSLDVVINRLPHAFVRPRRASAPAVPPPAVPTAAVPTAAVPHRGRASRGRAGRICDRGTGCSLGGAAKWRHRRDPAPRRRPRSDRSTCDLPGGWQLHAVAVAPGDTAARGKQAPRGSAPSAGDGPPFATALGRSVRGHRRRTYGGCHLRGPHRARRPHHHWRRLAIVAHGAGHQGALVACAGRGRAAGARGGRAVALRLVGAHRRVDRGEPPCAGAGPGGALVPFPDGGLISTPVRWTRSGATR